jgi:hypothetical protein
MLLRLRQREELRHLLLAWERRHLLLLSMLPSIRR